VGEAIDFGMTGFVPISSNSQRAASLHKNNTAPGERRGRPRFFDTVRRGWPTSVTRTNSPADESCLAGRGGGEGEAKRERTQTASLRNLVISSSEAEGLIAGEKVNGD